MLHSGPRFGKSKKYTSAKTYGFTNFLWNIFYSFGHFLADYRREFSDKKDGGGDVTNSSTVASSKVETKFGNVISRGRVGTSSATNTVDILNGVVGQNFDVDINDGNEKKTPATLAKFGGYDVVLAASAANSISGSPFVDKKMSTNKAKLFGGISNTGGGSKALLLFGNSAASPATSIRSGGLLLETSNPMTSASSPRLIAKTLSSPTCSEHQVNSTLGLLINDVMQIYRFSDSLPPLSH